MAKKKFRSYPDHLIRSVGSEWIGGQDSSDPFMERNEAYRLADVLAGPSSENSLAIPLHGHCSQGHDRDFTHARELANLSDCLESVHPGHLDVHEDKRGN